MNERDKSWSQCDDAERFRRFDATQRAFFESEERCRKLERDLKETERDLKETTQRADRLEKLLLALGDRL